MSIGTSLNITLPSVGSINWGGPLNVILRRIIDVIEAKIDAGSFDLTTELDFQGQLAINLAGLTFENVSADPHTAHAVYWLAGELYVNDGNGAAIQVTSGGLLAVGVNSSGFAGDYQNNGTAIYSSAGNLFSFESVAGTYSKVAIGQLQVHNGASTGYTSLVPPAGQTSNIDLTLFPALPTGRSVVTLDATGSLGLAAVTADGQGMIVSGSSFFSGSTGHITRTLFIDPAAGASGSVTSAGTTSYYRLGGWSLGGQTAAVDFAIPLIAGKRIIQIQWECFTGTAAFIATGSLISRVVGQSGTLQTIASVGFTKPNIGDYTVLTLSGSVASPITTLSNSGSYKIRLENDSTSTNVKVNSVKVTYDEPLS